MGYKLTKLSNLIVPLFGTILLVLILSKPASAQYGRPWNNCYQQDSSACDSCYNFAEVTDSLYYGDSCYIPVTYKKRVCYCPDPTVFLDIDYIRVDLTKCCDLVCKIHPPGPFHGCTPLDSSCWNNPPNADSLNKLITNLYDQLMDSMFTQIKFSYLCPHSIEYKYYFKGGCYNFCILYLRSTLGTHDSLGVDTATVYWPKACDSTVCCGVSVKYCLDTNNVWRKTVTKFKSQGECGYSNGLPCPPTGSHLFLNGKDYVIITELETFCTAPCNDNK